MLNRNIVARNASRGGYPIVDFFEDFWNPSGWGEKSPEIAFAPKCEITENEKEYLIHFEVPGIKEEDLAVEVKDGVLTVAGERKKTEEKKEKTLHYSETSYGQFERSFTLPENVDLTKIEAKHDRGVLTIIASKREVTPPLRIPISIKKN